MPGDLTNMEPVPTGSEFHPRTLKTASADAMPCDLEAERSVLSAIFLDSTNFRTVFSILGTVTGNSNDAERKKANFQEAASFGNPFFKRIATTMFREPMHAAVYEAMLSLEAAEIAIDALSVSDWLARAGRLDMIGGAEAIVELQMHIVSAAHLESWCQILRDYAMLREMIKTCSAALDRCRQGNEDVKQLLDKVESDIYNVRNKFIQSEIRELKDIIADTVRKLMLIKDKKTDPGIPTGYPDLDKLINGGLKPGEMFVLAARPSIGKTAFALNVIRNIIMKQNGEKRHCVAFFSLEMTDDQIVQRLLSTEAQVPLSSFYDGSFQNADLVKVTAAVSTLRKAKLHIDSTSGLSIFELRAKARKLKDLHGIDLIVIDYLQLMKAGDREKESRQVEVAAISGGLKAIAKELSIPVLVLAQLSRETEKTQGASKNQNSFPKLSHLRESGAIEQDADQVVFLHRNRDESKENPGEGMKDGVDAWVIVEKNRNGRTGVVKMRLVPHLMEFQSVEHKYSDADDPAKKKNT